MAAMTAPRLLLIDDHAMFRTGLSLVISSAIPAALIFEAGSLDEATSSAPDDLHLVLLDIRLTGLSGLEGLALLKRKWPLVPVLMLSSQDEPETVRLALARGAVGFVSKAETGDKIVATIHAVLKGNFPKLAGSAENMTQKCLTARQSEVLNLLHQGLSNKLIARKLTLSDNTVRRHVQDILQFFGVISRAEAVFAARQQSLID